MTDPLNHPPAPPNPAGLRIGILAHLAKENVLGAVHELRALLLEYGAEVLLEGQLAAQLGEKGHGITELNAQSDRLAILGGDGTILDFFRRLSLDAEPKPIVGVNLGRLGFLTSVARDRIADAVTLLLEPDLTNYEPRTMLNVRLVCAADCDDQGNHEVAYTALNEVTLTRGVVPRLVELEVFVSGQRVSVFNADGLIIATPTGSTAYSLAAGGPILTPSLPVLVIAPICPHVLTNRPLVVDQNERITVHARHTRGKDPQDVYVTVDGGDPRPISAGDYVEITLAPFVARLGIPADTSFFEILEKKLKWSGTNV